MSTPQGPQPPQGAPQQPAEQPAWGQQQPQAGWGGSPEGQQRPGEETRVVPQHDWDAPETSEVPRQDASEPQEQAQAPEPADAERGADGAAEGGEVDLFTPGEPAPEQKPQPPAGDTGDATTIVPAQGASHDDEAAPQEQQPQDQQQPQQQQAPQQPAWGAADQTQIAAPYVPNDQHFGAQQPQPGQQYPGQQPGGVQHTQPQQAHQGQQPSPFAPPGQQQPPYASQQQGPYGAAQPGYGQQAFGQPYAAQQPGAQQPGAQQPAAQQSGAPQSPAYGQQPTQQFGQPPQWGQQAQQAQYGQPGQQAYGQAPFGQQQAQQQSPWAGQQAAWQPGAGQQPGQQWGGRPDAQQQPWAGGYPAAAPEAQAATGGGKSRTPLIIGAAAVVLVLAVVGVLGFVSPGFFNTRVLDASAVQSGVQQVLSQDYDLEVQSVTCPDGQQVVPDATFECTAIVDGDQVSVPIKITSADGNYEVGRPA